MSLHRYQTRTEQLPVVAAWSCVRGSLKKPESFRDLAALTPMAQEGTH